MATAMVERLRRDDELDGYVRAFERAYAERGGADPAAFLPAGGHPLHAAVLRELVRVDLEFGWERGCPKNLAGYLRDFPSLSGDRRSLREIAFEEFRLRRQAGQRPSYAEYQENYGVWLEPAAFGSSVCGPPPVGATGQPRGAAAGPAAVLPEAGDQFLGFRLSRELGRGAFGRVFLARQGELADRPVVLKVTSCGRDESQALAQLRHDHIVPIYSYHCDGPLRAVCMPYLGSVTLQDVADGLKARGAPPESGRGLVASPVPCDAGGPAWAGGGADAPCPPAPDRADARDMLGEMTYVGAVVWMAARLADGLAHAHGRGILHRDLKPANVLLADDGRPMLLDFNLSEDLKRRPAPGDPAARVGGTLSYMAPEHLEACGDPDRGGAVDARSDLYSLGIIVYELLTGRPPFPARDGLPADVFAALADDRRGPPPRLRPFNPAVSPAVESIVRRCLEPDPSRRYQWAGELAEDLERHLADRPLRHAADPSRRERAGKWLRRNQRAVVVAVALTAALGALWGLAAAAAARSDQAGGRRAIEALREFRAGSTDAHGLLDSWIDGRIRPEGLDAARHALGVFHAQDDGAPTPWWSRPPASNVPAGEPVRLRREVGELLLLLAWAEARGTRTSPGVPAPAGQLREAMRLNRSAETCYAPGAVPRALWDQRAELLTELGADDAAAEAAGAARRTRLTSAADFYLTGSDRAYRGRTKEAFRMLREATRLDPGHYGSWLVTARLHERLLDDTKAKECYSTCVALRPGRSASWFNRGLLALRSCQFAEAWADFDRAARLRPGDPEPVVNRGLAALKLGRFAEAASDLNRAMDAGTAPTRLFLARSEARARSGDPEGAAADRREGLRREPADEASWVSVAPGNAVPRDRPHP